MYNRTNQVSKSQLHTVSIFCLLLVWCLGILIGSVIAQRNSRVLISLFRNMGTSAISHVRLLLVLLLPILISYCAFSFHVLGLIYLLCFAKGITYSYCVSGVLLTFGDASFLMHLLLLFSDTMLLISLFWLWIRNLGNNSLKYKRDTAASIFFLVFIYFLDIFFVSPFCMKLMNLL